jgi:hypothetical protein
MGLYGSKSALFGDSENLAFMTSTKDVDDAVKTQCCLSVNVSDGFPGR